MPNSNTSQISKPSSSQPAWVAELPQEDREWVMDLRNHRGFQVLEQVILQYMVRPARAQVLSEAELVEVYRLQGKMQRDTMLLDVFNHIQGRKS